MIYGIDFAFGNGLTTAQIKAAGKQFVCRYLSGGSSKDIGATELANYKAAGIVVVFVWETTGTDMVSEAAGFGDATAAHAELTRLGAPDAPVFFAADEQTEADETDYLKGTASVVGLARNGLYGGLASIQRAFNGGLITYGWQTYAWSGGVWDNRALLRQVQNGVTLGPATVDLDQAAYWGVATPVLTVADDFGQWPRPSAAPAPAQLPAGDVVVPDVTGKAGNAAIAVLEAAGLTGVLHSGSPVVSQTPGPGAVVAKGSNVNLGV